MPDPSLLRLLRGSGVYVRAAANVLLGPFIFRAAMKAQAGRFPDGRLALSFDCDFPADVEQLPRLAGLLAERGVRASFAVVGRWVERWPDQHRALVENGHELVNHTHTHPNLRNDAYEFSAGPEFTERRFESLSPGERREEVARCHDVVRDVLGVEMTGCRLPHFGNLRPEEPYPLLAELGYRYSSSAMAVLSPGCGAPFRTEYGLWEIPVTGCPRHPFTAFDTWHCLVKSGGRHSRPGEFARLFAEALALAEARGALANVYFDPKDVAGSGEFARMLDELAGRPKMKALTYSSLLEEMEESGP